MQNVKNKSFGKFIIVWIGQLVSSIGSGLTAFSLGVYAYQQTQTATSFALITLCSFLPSILLRPVGGVLVDRFDRRAMMILGDLGSASGLVFILGMMLAGNPELWHIYLGVTVTSVFVALQSPAYKASVTDLLTEDQFSKASGLVQLASSAQHLFSPVIAGVLMSVTGIGIVLLINISTFIVAILAVLFIRRDMQTEHGKSGNKNFWGDLNDGWHAITDHKGVLYLIIVISVVTFYIGFLQTLLGPMILSFSDARTFGTVQSVSAVGMLLSSLLLGIFTITGRYSRMLSIGLVFAGVSFSLMGLTTSVYFITVAGFMFFCALPLVNTSADVLVRKNIENGKQGRVWGIIGVLSQLGFVVAYAIAGPLADHVFNPLLAGDGILASPVGRVIGTGAGRGIGFLFLISGILVVCMGIITTGIKSIQQLDHKSSETHLK